MLAQERGQRGPKVHSLTPRVECIGSGKPHRFYEFGVKVSVATTLKRCEGGQFAIHAKTLPGNPCDGHTLAKIIPAIEQLIGNQIERLHADAGYRGHNAPADCTFRIYRSKQKRRITPQIKRGMRRRAAVKPENGHLKNEHRMDRNYLHHRSGDANNAILAAIGYNFSPSCGGSGFYCASSSPRSPNIPRRPPNPPPSESTFFTVDYVPIFRRSHGLAFDLEVQRKQVPAHCVGHEGFRLRSGIDRSRLLGPVLN